MKTTIIVTTIISDDKGKILLIKRANKAFFGTWGLPGGKVKYMEKVADANLREHKEELSVNLLQTEFLNFFEFTEPDHAIVFCYKAKIEDQIIPEASEILEFGWFDLEEIKNLNLAPNHMPLIVEYFKHKNG